MDVPEFIDGVTALPLRDSRPICACCDRGKLDVIKQWSDSCGGIIGVTLKCDAPYRANPPALDVAHVDQWTIAQPVLQFGTPAVAGNDAHERLSRAPPPVSRRRRTDR
jgi:hypothetical protein